VHDVVEGVFLGNMASENASDRDTSDDTTFVRNLRQGQSDQIALKLTKSGDMVTIIDVDPSMDWRFKTEAAAWKRIVMNLFGNAMKFTKKGQITVKLHLASAESETAQHICLEIRDTGSGIDKDYLKSHLFTAFSQADGISVGTGVGLSIVKRLVEELNGAIDVQSGDGLGTRVCVTVPLGEMTAPVNGADNLLHEEASLYANGRHKGHNLYVRGLASYLPKGEHEKVDGFRLHHHSCRCRLERANSVRQACP
jgi:anti-sigma regulatory factor (Ser/Thr protein kinase)